MLGPPSKKRVKKSNFQKVLQIGWFFVPGGFSTWGTRIRRNFFILTTGKGRIGQPDHGKEANRPTWKLTDSTLSRGQNKFREQKLLRISVSCDDKPQKTSILFICFIGKKVKSMFIKKEGLIDYIPHCTARTYIFKLIYMPSCSPNMVV